MGKSWSCNDSGATPLHASDLHADACADAGLLQKAANQDERQQQPRLEVILMAQQSPDQREQVLHASQRYELSCRILDSWESCKPPWQPAPFPCLSGVVTELPAEPAHLLSDPHKGRARPAEDPSAGLCRFLQLQASCSVVARAAMHSPQIRRPCSIQMSLCIHSRHARLPTMHRQPPQHWNRAVCALKGLLHAGSATPARGSEHLVGPLPPRLGHLPHRE